MLCRPIPATKELLPILGLGTWQTLNVSLTEDVGHSLQEVLHQLHKAGGSVIDSSPMYGRSEEVIGALAETSGIADNFFYATKVWTTGREQGIRQMEDSFRKLRRPLIDLMQIHNLVDWQTHLNTLRDWKDAGRIRYIGITHYLDDSHEALEHIMRSVPLDFVQFNYSIFDRHAEKRLLPAAAELGIATMINRPLSVGEAMHRVQNKPLPAWAHEWGIDSWSQFLLKFIVSHPAVNCAIPATSNPLHMEDNTRACADPIPDEETREKMAAYVATL